MSKYRVRSGQTFLYLGYNGWTKSRKGAYVFGHKFAAKEAARREGGYVVRIKNTSLPEADVAFIRCIAEAKKALHDAEEKYLHLRGWLRPNNTEWLEPRKTTGGIWTRRERKLSHRQAINSQLLEDAESPCAD